MMEIDIHLPLFHTSLNCQALLMCQALNARSVLNSHANLRLENFPLDKITVKIRSVRGIVWIWTRRFTTLPYSWIGFECSSERSCNREDGAMPETFDFERAWLAKLALGIEKQAGDGIRDEVLKDSQELNEKSSRADVIAWSKAALQRLEELVGENQARQIMTGCACQYPKDQLTDIQIEFEVEKNVDLAQKRLQERFIHFLEFDLGIDEAIIAKILSRGWGLAGVKQGNTIIATKLPKSGYLMDYLNESDSQRKRQYYCHCPRVRELLNTGETISPLYCYCGAGYYKGIWETITQRPVQVEVQASVLWGDEVCRIAIQLPEDIRS